MSDTNDLIGLAIDKNPVDFAEAFNELVRSKVQVALDERRIAIASSLYVEEVAEEDDLEEDFDEDFDEEEISEEDDLDEDLDLDDLDLSDLDAEFEDTEDDNEDA